MQKLNIINFGERCSYVCSFDVDDFIEILEKKYLKK